MIMRCKKIIAFSILTACATYTDQTAEVRSKLIHGQTSEAIQTLESSSIASRKRDEVLYRMERGMLHYLSGNYDRANKDWERSFRRSEELYTTSIANTAASIAMSEDMTDYEGEDHEKVFLPIFSAMAWFSTGDLNAALVEIRKAYNLISKLKLDSDGEVARIDGFPFLVSGLLYEANTNWDSAIIEYRKALKFYRKAQSDAFRSVIRLTADSLWRVAEFRNRTEIVKELEENGFARPVNNLETVMSKGEVFVVVEGGQSPIKVPRDHTLQGSEGIMNISFPTYQAITRASSFTVMNCDGNECLRTSKASDIGILAETALEKRRIRDFAKLVARLAIKAGTQAAVQKQFGEAAGFAMMLANAATERADTRSWTLLPENIQIARIVVNPDTPVRFSSANQYTVNGNSWVVKVPRGKKKFLRIRTMY
ncbi:MAG: COG3014 family protein [Silvanigrellaceae bacterium]